MPRSLQNRQIPDWISRLISFGYLCTHLLQMWWASNLTKNPDPELDVPLWVLKHYCKVVRFHPLPQRQYMKSPSTHVRQDVMISSRVYVQRIRCRIQEYCLGNNPLVPKACSTTKVLHKPMATNYINETAETTEKKYFEGNQCVWFGLLHFWKA